MVPADLSLRTRENEAKSQGIQRGFVLHRSTGSSDKNAIPGDNTLPRCIHDFIYVSNLEIKRGSRLNVTVVRSRECKNKKFKPNTIRKVARDSSVGIATRYGLDGPFIESRWGARYSASVQTGPGAHSASYTIGTESFPEGKASGSWR